MVGCEISDQDVKFIRISNLTGSTSVTAAFDGNIIFNHTGTVIRARLLRLLLVLQMTITVFSFIKNLVVRQGFKLSTLMMARDSHTAQL